jgi:hypothetical protein
MRRAPKRPLSRTKVRYTAEPSSSGTGPGLWSVLSAAFSGCSPTRRAERSTSAWSPRGLTSICLEKADFPPTGGIINGSQRGTNLVSGSLFLNGERVARLSRVTTGAAVLSLDAASSPARAEITRNAQPLPVPVPAGSSLPNAVQ